MYENDLEYLAEPFTQSVFQVGRVDQRAADGEVLEGTLLSVDSGREYPIRNGIPRFVSDATYNQTWDFKWTELDAGRGLNYRIIDKNDPAYQVHDLFDRNSHRGEVYKRATGGVAIDVGCGVGQYSVRLLNEYKPHKLIAPDLTGEVDVFRKIVTERYPELLKRLLIVQANIFEMPFRKQSFDFVMSLGVLMHTGDTKAAIARCIDLLKAGGHINFWVYGSEPVAYSVTEPDRGFVWTMKNIGSVQRRFRRVQWWIRLFRRLPPRIPVAMLRFMSSEPMFKFMQSRAGRFLHQWFPTVVHPDQAYRMINNYDGYVNKWSDSWGELELFRVLRDNGVVVRSFSEWRLGFWGLKDDTFYER